LLCHSTSFESVRAGDCNQVIDPQGDAEAIKAGA
jgi:hypothetical protein